MLNDKIDKKNNIKKEWYQSSLQFYTYDSNHMTEITTLN